MTTHRGQKCLAKNVISMIEYHKQYLILKISKRHKVFLTHRRKNELVALTSIFCSFYILPLF